MNQQKQETTYVKFLTVLLLVTLSHLTWAADPVRPKYGPEAKRLSLDHSYFKMHEAPDYWALAPYYIPQRDGASCSLASVTMVINALRIHEDLTSEEKLALQDDVLKNSKSELWQNNLGKAHNGVTLDQLKTVTEMSLAAYNIKDYQVEVFHMMDSSAKALEALRKNLIQNEKSGRDLIILNFAQGVYTGDADVGHIAPLGAYDIARHRALVMDPDREWYEPYWVSDAVLLRGMATTDTGSRMNRGYIWIHPKAAR